jgi:hypothetical protein
MSVPFLRDLLLSDSIYISNKITIDNLAPVSTFLAKVGNPAENGLSLQEFKRRQQLHHQAECAAMNDVPEFIHKAQDIYGYPHFINDAGGSVCELDCLEVIEQLAKNTLIIYIKIPLALERTIIERAKSDPKPLYYREEFLDEKLTEFMRLNNYATTDEMPPDEFVSWVFPELFKSRLPRYQAIADQYGYTVDANEVAGVKNEADFIRMISGALAK